MFNWINNALRTNEIRPAPAPQIQTNELPQMGGLMVQDNNVHMGETKNKKCRQDSNYNQFMD